MKANYLIGVAAAGLLFFSCSGHSSKAEADTAPMGDSTEITSVESGTATEETKAEENQQVETFIKEFYANYIFGEQDFDNVKSNFSKSVLERLAKEYGMECPDNNCYGYWVFRGDIQDFDKAEVTEVTPMEDHWYKVDFTADAKKYTIEIQASVEDGKVMITDYKNAKKA